jgi:hypothetical protein
VRVEADDRAVDLIAGAGVVAEIAGVLISAAAPEGSEHRPHAHRTHSDEQTPVHVASTTSSRDDDAPHRRDAGHTASLRTSSGFAGAIVDFFTVTRM